jgi:hypothetical protein
MTVAELLVLLSLLGLLLWALRPLRRAVQSVVARWFLRGRYGRVIEAKFTEVRPRPRGADEGEKQ